MWTATGLGLCHKQHGQHSRAKVTHPLLLRRRLGRLSADALRLGQVPRLPLRLPRGGLRHLTFFQSDARKDARRALERVAKQREREADRYSLDGADTEAVQQTMQQRPPRNVGQSDRACTWSARRFCSAAARARSSDASFASRACSAAAAASACEDRVGLRYRMRVEVQALCCSEPLWVYRRILCAIAQFGTCNAEHQAEHAVSLLTETAWNRTAWWLSSRCLAASDSAFAACVVAVRVEGCNKPYTSA